MTHCHLCSAPIPHHRDGCRAHSDLAMFERVFTRLSHEGRNEMLRSNLERHLRHHGRLDAETA